MNSHQDSRLFPTTCNQYNYVVCLIILSNVYEITFDMFENLNIYWWSANSIFPRHKRISVNNLKNVLCIGMKVFVFRTSLEDSSHSTPSPLSSAASSQASHSQIKIAQIKLNWIKITSGLPSHGPAAGTGASSCGCSGGKEERTQVFSWKVNHSSHT